MNPIKDIIIVGGGTAGLISALYLKTYYPDSNILVIKSSNIGIIGVGEGSTEHWEFFQRICQLDFKEVINKTDATIKTGILFKDWNFKGSQYVHSVEDHKDTYFQSAYGSLSYYNQMILDNQNNFFPLSPIFSSYYIKNNIPLFESLEPTNQYHFDTFKLNSFLTQKCIEKNIKFQDCIIKNIQQNNKGEIISLITDNDIKIKGDFFIDCSGFKRILMSKLGVKWKSFKEYLPMNEAITLTTDLNLKKGIEPYTTATALSSGWAWKIPTQTRYGNGYVFDNRYTNADSALNEFNQHLNTNIEKVAKNIKFEAGKLEKFWYKNCLSIGLSSSFAEPLEAQSIGFTILQLRSFIRYFKIYSFDKKINKDYNDNLSKSFDNIIDYLQLHYLTKRNDSKFWKDKPFTLTDFNKNTLERFSHGVFLMDELQGENIMFKVPHFYQIYSGLELLNKKTIGYYYQNFPKKLLEIFKNYTKNHPKLEWNSISHIDYLKLIKENYSS